MLFLDFIASAPKTGGRGVGGALYERVREEARSLGALGVFCECEPDERAECESDAEYQQNVARLRFYESYGARPVDGTDYTLPLSPDRSGMPLLVFDAVGRDTLPSRDQARAVVRTVLERKYAWLCPPDYVDRVVESFRDDPIRLRPLRFRKAATAQAPTAPVRPFESTVALVVNEGHEIHHVRDRGYVESPVRIPVILRELDRTDFFQRVAAAASSRIATSRRSTTRGWSYVPESAAARACRRASRSTPTSSRSATRRARPRSCRCARATTASTPSRRSTATPTWPRAAPSTAR